MDNDDLLPPLGSPDMRRISAAAKTEIIPIKPVSVQETATELPLGVPIGAPSYSAPISSETRRKREANDERARIEIETEASGQIVNVIPELRLPRWLTGGGLLFGVFAILSLVGLFVFAQTITLLAHVAILPKLIRWSSYLLIGVLIGGIVLGVARLLIAYVRLRRTQRITLRGIDSLNERAQFRRLAAGEIDKAHRLVLKYLDDFPTDRGALVKLGFSDELAKKLLSSRSELADPSKHLGTTDWLKRFRQDFQSVVDKAADACIKRHAQRVGLKVAALPWALVDVAVVLRGAFMMIGDLCKIYRLRLGAAETLIVMGWAAVQSIFAGKIEEYTGNKGESWGHDSGQHATGGEAAANSAPDGGAETDTASDSGAATDAATATTHILGDIHVPFVGRVFKRATKGVVQGMLLWRLGRLTKRWLRMVE